MYSPFLPRPISSFQRCHTLNDNCAVMQHCTHMKFLSFFVTDRALFWWYLITSGFLIFFLNQKPLKILKKNVLS
ncbi:unnamed protein product [Staurois parvus]|uniref:ATP synthase F0 subunit 8 n=1 Tax=Staurois parvus TaxID=386267 RepID=A0ABN9DDY7_9NEOB|nr:unnamed protein product [Staurois parvus]